MTDDRKSFSSVHCRLSCVVCAPSSARPEVNVFRTRLGSLRRVRVV
jgi:hypothetical protein